jgi:hypothetical protein
MEVAVMSLSMREQQALDSIENNLAGSAPRLAALLATFARLISGEAMPAREEIRVQAYWTRRIFGRTRRLLASYAGLDQALALLWLLVSVGAITVAVALSGGGRAEACVGCWPVACTARAICPPRGSADSLVIHQLTRRSRPVWRSLRCHR